MNTVIAVPSLRRTTAHAAVLARRNLMSSIRRPDVLLLSTIQPIVFMLMFLYVFGGAIEFALPGAANGDYVNWLVPGILAQFAVFGASATAFGLNDDRTSGVLDRFRSLPMARSAVLAGRTTADLMRAAVILLLQLAVGILLGFRWQNGVLGLIAGVGLALAFCYACTWITATLGMVVRSTEAIQAAVYMVVFPLTLVSSVFLPTQTMPGWLQAFAEHQPITAIADALRGLMLGAGALPPGQTVAGQAMVALAWIGGITAICVPLAVRAYRRAAT
ncbi:ABC transporter permease [Phytoactinopolyspora halotolerans]|uniref:Transport permease protein n=1 Tax=Phytoactinopolyspora halotolerans TaxID=1981512 RepID=A0A6L9SIC0_9ACTN|nr:ABC transporter permease [Phytoactinopolyspora halotolerans]NEE03810.1 ABC transporter permease [Phytoactinopolyspora halotolerans]